MAETCQAAVEEASSAARVHRYRMTYAKGRAVRFISHLDLVRTLERGFRRARLPLAYSQGFNPHPRISVAAPLALGWTCDADVVDVDLARRCHEGALCERLSAALPAGITLTSARELDPGAPAAMSQVREAAYLVRARGGGEAAVAAAVRRLLASTAAVVPRRPARGGAQRSLDARPLIVALEVRPGGGEDVLLAMRLLVGSSANAKPEHVLAALAPPALEAVAVHRTRLELAGAEAPRPAAIA